MPVSKSEQEKQMKEEKVRLENEVYKYNYIFLELLKKLR